MEKQRHTVIPRTLCFVFNKKNEILLMHRAGTKFDAGMYNALGGHIELGEDVIDCANREITEESGLVPAQTVISGIIHAANFFGKNVIMFVTTSFVEDDKFQSSEEGELKWVPISELPNYKIYADMMQMIEMSDFGRKKFHGTTLYNGEGVLLEIKLVAE